MSEATIDIKQYQMHEKDTGSAEVQVALISQRINHLTKHLSTNSKDFSSRRGLLKLVALRRRILDYMREKENARYQKVIKSLGLRR